MKRPIPDEVVLGLLLAQPAHGYELLECFRDRAQLGRIWTMSTSQIYAVLKRLEREGAIRGRELAVPNAPARVEYAVTETGKQQLDMWLYEPNPPASIHRIRVLFLSRVFIAKLLGMPLDSIVRAQISACQTQRDRFIKQSQQNIADIEKLALDFVINQLDSAVSWLSQHDFEPLRQHSVEEVS